MYPYSSSIYSISTEAEFNTLALEVFKFQSEHVDIYKQFLHHRAVQPHTITHHSQIPFLPISFFKSHKVLATDKQPSVVFESSKTTASQASKHYVADASIYEESFTQAFSLFYGNPEEYIILALLPSYLERANSSLVYMVETLIRLSKNSASGFYLYNHNDLFSVISANQHKKIILFGVAFALLDFAEDYTIAHKNLTIIETGGMKGQRKELIREELHSRIASAFPCSAIHSEYGMTELLSQAYMHDGGRFKSPPWMRILIRDLYDPFSYLPHNALGGINVIDLANVYSCAFIETQDIGRADECNSFTVEGRFDQSEIRGCNLMVI